MLKLTATWNGARGAWEKTETGPCGHSVLFSETLPASGTMRNGVLYAPATPEHRTAGNAFSSGRRLLPTPNATDWKGAGQYPGRTRNGKTRPVSDNDLPAAVKYELGPSWGPYLRAVRRWEDVTGRKAPSPEEPNRNGSQALSPLFVEWMMGMSPGRVTGVPGLSRKNQLKLLGNSVCYQQAVLALSSLLHTPEVIWDGETHRGNL